MRRHRLLGELRSIIAELSELEGEQLRKRADDALCHRYVLVLSQVPHVPSRLRLAPSDDADRRWGVTSFTLLSKALALELFVKEANTGGQG